MSQNGDYFGHLRTDVLALVPEGAQRVLSLGCGGGRTEAELVKRGASVLGIEPHEPAARAAEQRGLEMLVGDADSTVGALAGREFDCLIYADVLEHIRDPEAVLEAHVPLLKPGGSVIISVPNFRHYSVLKHIFIKGEPPYTDAGIFDRTHVRLTTRKLIRRWVEGAGLRIQRVELRAWRRREELISKFLWGGLRELFAYQVLTLAIKPDDASPYPNPVSGAAG
jgi:methionine biosynthesis protein MetW